MSYTRQYYYSNRELLNLKYLRHFKLINWPGHPLLIAHVRVPSLASNSVVYSAPSRLSKSIHLPSCKLIIVSHCIVYVPQVTNLVI